MKSSFKKGLSFGLTSGIITTLGLIAGLHSGSGSKSIIIGGVIVIAIADALSDALGIHIAEESSNNNHKEVWEATIATFLAKFFFALSFVIPLLIFSLSLAMAVSVVYGLTLLGLFSYYIAKQQGTNPVYVIFEHLIIAIIVIVVTHYVGNVVKVYIN